MKISKKDRVHIEENKSRVSNVDSLREIVTERRLRDYGTTSENALIIHDVSSHEAIHRARNHMAEYGNYPVGMSGCYVVGLNGGCGIDCPVFKDGECKSHDGFPEDELIKYGYIEVIA